MAAFGPLGTLASAAAASATAAYYVGIFGDVTAVLVYLYPLFMLHDIWKKKSVDQYHANPFIVGFLNCTLWGLYGLPAVQTHGSLMLSLNAFGMAMMLIYLTVFLYYCTDEERRYKLYYALYGVTAFLVCLGAVVMTLVPEPKHRSFVLGIFGIITASSMYAVPVMDILRVCVTKKVEFTPGLLGTAVSLLNAVVWTAYAAITTDHFVLIPNLVGLVVPVVQLAVYLAVYYHYHKKAQAGNAAQPGKGTDMIKPKLVS